MNVSNVTCLLLFLLTCQHQGFLIPCSADQISSLNKLIKSRRSQNPPNTALWDEDELIETSRSRGFVPVYLGPQEGLMEADKIKALPGQPEGVDFDQYGGYVTVDPTAGRALFYYFVESPHNSSSKPLVLWLNGGPGCSSLGFGAMQELGPFRLNRDKNTLFRNKYAWNEVANVLFLESPAGVGFSYSNKSSDYDTGDKKTAKDSYTFLINWLNRFPQYKTRDFFITGESYAGHYVPQFAYTILSNNKHTNQTFINLKGIAIGNAYIDENTGLQGMYDYYWTHALNSDETHEAINKHCDYVSGNYSNKCYYYQNQGQRESGHIDIYNIYAPFCHNEAPNPSSPSSVNDFDPCSTDYVLHYLNRANVQKALHARNTSWVECGAVGWTESPKTTLPTIKKLIESGISIWLFSGDTDARVPITSSRYAINTLKLPVETAWRPWYHNREVGGYVERYKGVVLVTVREAGHTVPSYQPERALAMISSFLKGKLPPSF